MMMLGWLVVAFGVCVTAVVFVALCLHTWRFFCGAEQKRSDP